MSFALQRGAGDIDIAVAGGMESMSNCPYLLAKAREGLRMGDGTLIDSMIHDGLWDSFNNVHMGLCGDRCASKFEFTRAQQDEFAVASYKRALAAQSSGVFADEIVPIDAPAGKTTVSVKRMKLPKSLTKKN